MTFSRNLRLVMVTATLGAMNSCASPQVTDSDLTYQITVAQSRKVAMIAPSTPLATIQNLESAASRETGCQATAIDRVYAAVDQDRSTAVPASLYRGFGGRLPVTLDCS
ncbi:hypothetical protein [Loktanella sp. R86503]|uniref:hypothetical protein n=1 Tax=Loktanella sp. R86503 TaxID=3093847 RepID=UPI0036DDFD0E